MDVPAVYVEGAGSQVFGGAALREAAASVLSVPQTPVTGGRAPRAPALVTYTVGGAVSSELSRRFAEAEVDAAAEDAASFQVIGGAAKPSKPRRKKQEKTAAGAAYVERYYPGRTFVTSDDVAASVLEHAGAAEPLRSALLGVAAVAMRAGMERGYVLAGVVNLEALARDPFADPAAVCEAVVDVSALLPARRATGGAASKKMRTAAVRDSAPMSPMSPIPLPDAPPSLDAVEHVTVPPEQLAPPTLPAMLRRRSADAADAEDVRRLEARMAYHLTALEEWATMLAAYVERVRRELAGE